VKRLISIGVIIAILAIMLMPVLAGAMIINDGGGPYVLTSTYQHHIVGMFGTTTITYTFQTYVDWTAQGFDKLSVRIQVWAGYTAQRAQATAKVDRTYYTKFLWWYIKHSQNVFSQYLVANPITQSYADHTWGPLQVTSGVEYVLTSNLQCWDLDLSDGGPDEEGTLPQIVQPARDAIYTTP
jgi:hypothetical protein